MTNALLVATGLAVAALNGSADVQHTIAWRGAVSTQAFTELSVVARGEPGDALEFSTESGSPHVKAVLKIGERRESRIGVPVVVGSGVIGYQVNSGTGIIRRQTEALSPVANGPVALIGHAAALYLGDTPNAMALAAADLPRLATAYAHVNAVVIDSISLAQLDEAQLLALLEHVGNCGRLLLIDATTDVNTQFTQRSACRGESFLAVHHDEDVPIALQNLQDFSVRDLPSVAALQRLFDRNSADIFLLFVFLCAFLLVFLLLVSAPRTRLAALGFCLLATVSAGLLWTGAHRASFVAWAEVDGDAGIARYAGLESVVSDARGDQAIYLQSLARSPTWISGDDLSLYWSNVSTERRLNWTPHVLQSLQVTSAGSFPVEPTLRAGMADGTPVVCNLGASATPQSFLRWQGNTYSVPSLAPTEQWSTHEADTVVPRSAALALFASRTMPGTIALLRPLGLVDDANARQRAWLLRVESEDAGASPCHG